MKSLPLNSEEYGQTIWLAIDTVWSRHHGRLFPINIQYPPFFSVMQSPFANWHSSFSPTTFFEIGIYYLALLLWWAWNSCQVKVSFPYGLFSSRDPRLHPMKIPIQFPWIRIFRSTWVKFRILPKLCLSIFIDYHDEALSHSLGYILPK